MKYLAKFLPVEGEIKKGDWFMWQDEGTDKPYYFKCIGLTEDTHLKVKWSKEIGCYWRDEFNEYEYGDWNKAFAKKVKLFLFSREIKVGDKCLHPWSGGVKGSREGTLQWDVKLEDLKEENLHIILDLNHDPSYEPYAIKTDKGFGWRNNKTGEQAYIKVIGEISPNAIWVTKNMEFDEDELMWSIFDDYGLDEIDRCSFNELKEPSEFDKIIIKCPTCKIFH